MSYSVLNILGRCHIHSRYCYFVATPSISGVERDHDSIVRESPAGAILSWFALAQ
jgi:hypothetical protein